MPASSPGIGRSAERESESPAISYFASGTKSGWPYFSRPNSPIAFCTAGVTSHSANRFASFSRAFGCFSGVHDDDAVGVPELLPALDEDREIEALPEREEGAAVGQRVGPLLGRDPGRLSHPLSGGDVPGLSGGS